MVCPCDSADFGEQGLDRIADSSLPRIRSSPHDLGMVDSERRSWRDLGCGPMGHCLAVCLVSILSIPDVVGGAGEHPDFMQKECDLTRRPVFARLEIDLIRAHRVGPV